MNEAEEYPSPNILDSRRLMGPNLFSNREGAVLLVRVATSFETPTGDEQSLADDLAQRLAVAWRTLVSRTYALLDWPVAECVTRRRAEGTELFCTAPIDGLMTATEVSEWAWASAERHVIDGRELEIAAAECERLREVANAERTRRANMRKLQQNALLRGVNCAFDDDLISIGSGASVCVWPLSQIPTAESVNWAAVRDMPIALVTGSNGKTTTTRLVAAMWRSAERRSGISCSDGVWVGGEQVKTGDYSGPTGAREVLRDVRVQAAVLETARGGMLRRGLAMQRVHAAIITNIAADHFGEYGVSSLNDLADVKFIVARAVPADGHLVLNADDATLVASAAARESAAGAATTATPGLVDARTVATLVARVHTIDGASVPVSWFSTKREHPAIDAHIGRGGNAVTVRGGRVVLHLDHDRHDLGDVADMPLTLGGSASHNISNLAGASLLAACVGVPIAAIRATLLAFGTSPADNPGRLQLHRFGDVTVVVDYAHNPEGLAALCRAAQALPAQRRLLLLGQAGDRDDTQLRELVRAAWSVTVFDRVIVKEMPEMWRGRAPGATVAVLRDELARLGVAEDHLEMSPTEFEGIHRALRWACRGDVLVCPVHSETPRVVAWLARLHDAKWRAGTPLPD